MDSSGDLSPGQIVISKMGRDSGRYFVVIAVEGGYAYIADGELRKIDKPKKKNIKHLLRTNEYDDAIRDKILGGKKISNADLRKALEKFKKA
ncbi:KOW domain-containing RNA-binding protein [Caldanaerobius polysaccharolyticus]|uniref:KOW domain-containing RNA-binding protein n=1 Tax=Caldanaerobius polysaccharolyticus TaxID=44256 RepID=UPI00047E31B5|nr:KOW domain-containing RNA-binding protein [Caldanaerobius polysaccharolyticus]